MTDKLFHEIDDAYVILYSGGVYRQAKMYRRYNGAEHQLFAKWGSGYIRLCAQGGTTVPKVTWSAGADPSRGVRFGNLGAPVLDM